MSLLKQQKEKATDGIKSYVLIHHTVATDIGKKLSIVRQAFS